MVSADAVVRNADLAAGDTVEVRGSWRRADGIVMAFDTLRGTVVRVGEQAVIIQPAIWTPGQTLAVPAACLLRCA